jgi:ethanolamine ammonia-lyase large subunit
MIIFKFNYYIFEIIYKSKKVNQALIKANKKNKNKNKAGVAS